MSRENCRDRGLRRIHSDKTVGINIPIDTKKRCQNTDTVSQAHDFKKSGLSHASEALAAVDRTVRLGLERNSCLAAAVSADSSEVLTGAAGSSLAGITAGLAALRLILEASLSIKLLFTSGEHELFATLFAY